MRVDYVIKIKNLLKRNYYRVEESLALYLMSQILPYYKNNDKGHNVNHVYYVLKRSFWFANKIKQDLNYNIICALAFLHDAKYCESVDNHEKLAAQCLQNDGFLKKYFTQKQIEIMSNALIYHDTKQDSSISIYAKILRTSDCNSDIKTLLKRLYEFRQKYRRDMNNEDKIKDAYGYFRFMYGKDGLEINKNCFYDKHFQKMLKAVNKFLSNEKLFIKFYKKVNHIK